MNNRKGKEIMNPINIIAIIIVAIILGSVVIGILGGLIGIAFAVIGFILELLAGVLFHPVTLTILAGFLVYKFIWPAVKKRMD